MVGDLSANHSLKLMFHGQSPFDGEGPFGRVTTKFMYLNALSSIPHRSHWRRLVTRCVVRLKQSAKEERGMPNSLRFLLNQAARHMSTQEV